MEVPAAWLTTVVTHLCLNRLASARARRESYAGPWLPEPVLTADGALGPLETAEQRESVSMGVLLLLERLTPAERAVFILREAFGHPYKEIAAIVDLDEAHCRQLHRRARARVGESGRRHEVDREHHRRILEGFFAAVTDGDVATLERLLADDVTVWADGGGGRAARRPVTGRDVVVRYLRGLGERPEASRMRAEIAEVNGEPAVLVREGAELWAIVAVEVVGGRVGAVRMVVNPAKLAFAATQIAV